MSMDFKAEQPLTTPRETTPSGLENSLIQKGKLPILLSPMMETKSVAPALDPSTSHKEVG